MAFQLYPSFNFDESDVGLRPVRPAGLDRIAIVGEFSRGFLTPTIGNYNDSIAIFGKSLHTGSIGLQAANLQGADDFLIARVLNPGTKAFYNTTITGTASTSGSVAITLVDSTGSHPLGSFTINSGDGSADVAAVIRNAVNLAGFEVEALEGTTPVQIKFQARNFGTAGNSITVQAVFTGATGIAATPAISTATNLASGANGPINASRTLLSAPSATLTVAYTRTVGDQILVTLNGVTTTVTLASGENTTVTTVATAIANGLNAAAGFASLATASSAVGVVTIRSRSGMAYSLSASETSSTGTITASGAVLVGTDIIKLTAISPGIWANSVQISVLQGSTASQITVVASIPSEAISETFTDIDISDLYDVDMLSAFRSSVLIRAQLLNSVLTPGTLTNQLLTGGSDGPTVTTQDYINAIDSLRDYYCTFVVAPGLKAPSISQASIDNALVAHAEYVFNTLGEEAGLRMAILSAPRNTKIADLPALSAANRIPNSKHAAMVMGWGTMSSQPKLRRFGVSPDAVMAGHLVSTPVQVSAAARTSSPFIQGILEVDTPVGSTAKNEITKYRMDAFILESTGGIHALNGRSTSSDGAWYWTCIRRVYNKIRMDLYFGLQFIKSEPQDKAFDRVVQDTGNAYLDSLLQLGILNGYNPVISNDSNNSNESRASGLRFIDFGIEPKYPADRINIKISRTLEGQVRLQS